MNIKAIVPIAAVVAAIAGVGSSYSKADPSSVTFYRDPLSPKLTQVLSDYIFKTAGLAPGCSSDQTQYCKVTVTQNTIPTVSGTHPNSTAIDPVFTLGQYRGQ